MAKREAKARTANAQSTMFTIEGAEECNISVIVLNHVSPPHNRGPPSSQSTLSTSPVELLLAFPAD